MVFSIRLRTTRDPHRHRVTPLVIYSRTHSVFREGERIGVFFHVRISLSLTPFSFLGPEIKMDSVYRQSAGGFKKQFKEIFFNMLTLPRVIRQIVRCALITTTFYVWTNYHDAK